MSEASFATETNDTSDSSELGAIETRTTERVGENRTQLQETLSKIRSNADLSESAKQRYADEASREASERHAEIVDDYERQSAEALAQSEQAVFALSYPHTLTASEKAEFRSAYREASFRTLDLEPEQLERVLARARRTGDRALELACYHESVDRGLFSIAEEYRERNPDAKTAWERYAATRRASESNSALLGRALLSSANPSSAE
jgi:hypothetical protein